MKPLPQQYDHPTTEQKWQQHWVAEGTYAWDSTQPRSNTFVIDTPPPTVSGLLHMGHIFSYTQADFVARYQRMSGKTVFYPMGFDDNGLPTERLVEKVKGIRGANMPREEFIAQCQSVVEEAEEEFRRLFKSVALSVDWTQEYQTISKDSRRISQMSFLDLFKKAKVERRLQPTLWDPVDQTAIAQAEIEDKELPSFANDITFGLVDANTDLTSIKWNDIEKVTVMTTRPELLPACVALMCHPDDAAKYRGKKAVTPLFGVVVDIIADDKVDKEKGTGLVMCCTFGDETDIFWWKKHHLPIRIVLTKQGRIDLSGEWLQPQKERAYCSTLDDKLKELAGLKVSNTDPKHPGARQKILELLKEFGCLLEQKPITHAVKCAERSGAPLEILVTPQWFVKILDEKAALLKRSEECNWYPKYMKIRMDQWIEGLSWDWCISRQRFFGVPFPVWYSKRAGEEGKILVAEKDQLPVNPLVDLPKGYSRDEVEPDYDVMDTWATSSVTPQLSSRGITQEFAIDWQRHQQLFPADMRPQAHEIIRTWAFYTMVKAHLHEQTIPWKNLMISGWCLAADKTKMSKSKGNVVTPVHLIEEKGADVVRYWASTSRLGADTAYSEDVLKIGKKLVNKLWNATKFAAIHLDKLSAKPRSAVEEVKSGIISEPLDLWILTRLQRTITKATEEFEKFEYCNARVAVEEFFWKDFCDNYLELVKGRAYAEHPAVSKDMQRSAVHTIHHCLDALLRLFAPFLPHITEELYSHIFDADYANTQSLHTRGMWPKATNYPVQETAEKEGIACVSVLDVIRKLKAERNVSIKWPLTNVTISPAKPEAASQDWLSDLATDLKSVANAEEVVWSPMAAQAGATLSEDGLYAVTVVFGEKTGE